MPALLPFLRPPPFPHAKIVIQDFVKQKITVETFQQTDFTSPLSADEKQHIQILKEQLLKSQVGGNFWSPSLPFSSIKRRAIVVQDTVEIAYFEENVRPMEGDIFLLPDHPKIKPIAQKLRKKDRTIHMGDFNPWSLLNQTHEIFISKQHNLYIDIGLIALLGNISLTEFSEKTKTQTPFSNPNGQILDQWINQLLIQQTEYYDIFTKQSASPQEAIKQLTDWRIIIESNRPIKAACGMAWWKKQAIRSFLWSGETTPLAMPNKTAKALSYLEKPKDTIALWPSREPKGLREQVLKKEGHIDEVEDGFIRSVGLGSGLHPPLSIVVDKQGIYYDPNHPSDIETLFNETDFSPLLLERAENLIAQIKAAGISKYMGDRTRGKLDLPQGRRKILVTGQVEDDRSVKLGGGDVKGNLDLLCRVRNAEPDSYIIFKPHPDVEAGHRKGFVAQEEVEQYADVIIRNYPINAFFDQIDAIHVWTSLAGFEALLRGCEVVCHGIPFYAGWGLTHDLGVIPNRRKRCLTLTELAAVTLILYPRYLDPVTGMPCSPEILIERLIKTPKAKMTLVTRLRQLQGRICSIIAWYRH
ncbi:MAG: capsular biosynthesis protein [Zymomonas mobilis subsp. pomaceae]|uniref:capsular polysaccharide export protein, LipB/KpsS family n=1 Tax=Zymomonas mobilis TaxID=542 RepID=UPI0039EB8F8F